MHALRRNARGPLTMLLAALALVSLVAMPRVQAQAPLCPSVVVSAYARPRTARKAGQAFTVYAKVRTTGTTPLHNVSLGVSVPFSATYPRPKPNDAAKGRPVIVPPNAFWPSFSLLPGKDRVFKLGGKVAKCAQSGTFNVGVAAYILDTGCITPIGAPVEVR
jgi:hypothetical protein